MKRSLLTLLLVAALGGSGVSAQVYRWVDENGVTHFGDKAPEGQRAKQVQISPPAAKTTPSSRHAYDPQKLRENEQRYLEAVVAERRARERRKAEKEAQEVARTNYCKQLYKQLLNYREGFAMVRRNDQNEIEHLPDQEVKARHASLEALWQERCTDQRL